MHAAIGAARFWAIAVGTIVLIFAFVGIETWLSGKIGWPEAYGFQCHRRCLYTKLGHSLQLLGGDGYAWSLFALYWSAPALVLGSLCIGFWRRRRRNPILPMEKNDF